MSSSVTSPLDQRHGAEVYLPIANSVDLSEDDMHGMLVSYDLPLLVSWPKRNLNVPMWLPDMKTRLAKVVDCYDHLPPKHIGHLQVLGFVKVNESWVLHGKIQYKWGDILNHSVLKPIHLVTLEKNKVRDDPGEGRQTCGIIRAKTDPFNGSDHHLQSFLCSVGAPHG